MLPLLLDVDSYKLSHWKQMPPGVSYMHSYLESRGGAYPETVFFGLQYLLQQYFTMPIQGYEVEEMEKFAEKHGVPFNYDGWIRIVDVHKGLIPVRIRAVPEGTVVPTGNVLMTVESTDPECFWVVSWIETLLMRLWYPTTVCTRSYFLKKTIYHYLEMTSDDPDAEINFKLHDFGSRGVSSQESAMIGGAAHLVNFMGSDTVAGIWTANEYYGHEMAGFSICASEHSTMTMWGKANEAMAYANMLDAYKDQPIFACVSDSYDIFNAIDNIWGGELKDKVIAYKGTLVIRPDSGNPITVVLECLRRMENQFGATVNSKGYKVINHNVRLIQGDGINEESLQDILEVITRAGYSATNVAFGMGGGLLQKDTDRDTCKFAFKCSVAIVDGIDRDVYKEPVTDAGKASKRGRLELVLDKDGKYQTIRRELAPAQGSLVLRDVYINGEILVEDSFEDVRNRTK